MVVGGVQLSVTRNDPGQNIAKAEHYVEAAKEAGADLVCLQEYFATGLFTEEMKPGNWSLAQGLDGPLVLRMSKLAKLLKLWLIVPLFERDNKVSGLYYNSAVVIDSEGRVVGLYRKQFIPIGRSYEKYYFTPGNLGTPVFKCNDLRFGIMICYDRHFFELPRILALKGASAIFIPNSSFRSRERSDIWIPELISIAATSAVYVVAVNSTGFNDGRDQFGQSVIVDPLGTIVDQLDEEDGFIIAEISEEAVRTARHKNRVLRDLRKDVVQELFSALEPKKPI